MYIVRSEEQYLCIKVVMTIIYIISVVLFYHLFPARAVYLIKPCIRVLCVVH